jgi:protein-tyrosine-phosphatase
VSVLGALADATRLRIVDALMVGDASPGELAAQLHLPTNLLAHHVHVLEDAGIVTRARSEADRRRSYLRLVPSALDEILPGPRLAAPRVVFVCTQNSARSQFATALWRTRSRVPVASGGTHPAERIHPGALAAATRHGLTLPARRPRHVSDVVRPGDLLVSVCDAAHEVLAGHRDAHLHWSVPDPVRPGTDEAFDLAFDEIAGRVGRLATTVEPVLAERDVR